MHLSPDWPLDPNVIYLNHGTVGVTPTPVRLVQQQIRDEIERGPSQAVLRDQSGLTGQPTGKPSRVRQAAHAVAAAMGALGEDLVFVDNATTGVNAVLRSFRLEPGDEILITDHNYGATAKVAQFVARDRGAYVRTAAVPYPRFDPGELIASVEAAITLRTRIAVLDHITSETALVFPLAELAAACRRRGVAVLVDAAHAPGVLPLNLPSLGVDWYTANLHKWACAPRSAGVLWAAPDRQSDLHPAVISWGLDQGFAAEFDWVGTRDMSAWLAAPAGFDFLRHLGLDRVWKQNHALAWTGAQYLADRWATSLGYRDSDIGFMATVPLPPGAGSTVADAARLRDALLFQHRIEVQLHAAHGRLWTRISAQVYNEMSDIERLGQAIVR